MELCFPCFGSRHYFRPATNGPSVNRSISMQWCYLSGIFTTSYITAGNFNLYNRKCHIPSFVPGKKGAGALISMQPS
jgi:hypothetical protein